MRRQEYLTELFYPTRFYDFMSPIMMDYLAALHGFPAHDLQKSFTYCELGCGGGTTTNVLAAANPQGQFYGIDINPEHIAYAQEEAKQGQINNIQFIEADINALGDELPDFDFISIHGVYSWVSEKTRVGIQKFIQKKLKTDGLLMLSYNAMPGSSMIQPMRDMMLTYTAGMEDKPALERVHEGVKYLKYLVEHNAAFFTENPLAKTAIDNYMERNDHYLAHEFFNEYWQPFYFSEVADHMSQVGLSFVGTLPISTNYLETSVPAAFHAVFKEAPDRVTLERHKAFVRNDRFRRDIYVKADNDALAESERTNLFQHFYFGTEYDTIEQKVVLENGQDEIHLDYTTKPTEDVASSLLQTTLNLEGLQRQSELKNETQAQLLESVHALILGGVCRAFVHAGEKPKITSAHQIGICIPNAYNRYCLEHSHTVEDAGLYIASPVMGDGIYLSLVEGILLYALSQTAIENAPNWALERLEAVDKHLNVRGEAITDTQAQLELLQAELEQLMTQRLGKFFELGVIIPLETESSAPV